MKRLLIYFLLTINVVLGQSQAPKSAEPAEMARLRESWQRTKQQALAPINKKYMGALLELKMRLAKAGNLDQALLVDAELKKMPPDAPRLPLAKRKLTVEMLIFGEWKFENRTTNYTKPMVFTSDGKCTGKGAAEPMGTWRIKGNVLRMEPNKNWNEFDLDLDESDGALTLHEINSNSGRRKGVVLTQSLSN